MKTYLRAVTLAGALLLSVLLLPESLLAQDLQYTSKTRFELPGAAGRAMNVVSRIAGGSNESVETVYLRGKYMRTDTDETSTIFDLENGRFVMLDHDRKTYSVMNFTDMAAMAEEMAGRAEEAMAEARAEADADARRELEEANAEIEYDVDVRRTGQTRTINGHRAERVLMTLSARGRAIAENEGEEDVEGALVLANEMWLTNDPSGDLQPLFDFQEQMAKDMMGEMDEFGAQAQSFGEGLQSAFAADPRMGGMMEKAAEEMSKLDGVSLLSTIKLVAVPGNLQFDADAAFSDEGAKSNDTSVAQQATRAARGFLRGRLGRGNNDDAEEEEQDRTPKQSTIMTVVTEIADVQRASLSDDLFAIPSGYTERDLMNFYE